MWKRAIDNSWALHREHMRSGPCLVLHGPDPIEVYPPASWREVEAALRHELRYVRKHLRDYPDYCILNLCRLMYSYETRDVVVSKAAAAVWARRTLPECKHLIVAAERAYAGRGDAAERKLMLAEVGSLFDFARARIKQAAARRSGRRRRPRADTTVRLMTRSRPHKSDL